VRTFVVAAVLGFASLGPALAQERPGAGVDFTHVDGSTDAVGTGRTGTGDAQGAGNSGRPSRSRNDDPGPHGETLGSTAGTNSGSPPSGRELLSGHEFKEGASQRGVSGHIDLVTPDGGYGYRGLRRRAERKSLIANATKKTTPPAVTVYGSTPNAGLSLKTDLSGRNSIGVVQPKGNGGDPAWTFHGVTGSTTPPRSLITAGIVSGGSPLGDAGGEGHHPPPYMIPANPPKAPLNSIGVNGTAFSHVAPGSGVIGGPAKDRSAINGSAFRPKFQ
jgi:hypothetical protein